MCMIGDNIIYELHIVFCIISLFQFPSNSIAGLAGQSQLSIMLNKFFPTICLSFEHFDEIEPLITTITVLQANDCYV